MGSRSHCLSRGAVRAAVLALGCVLREAAAQPVNVAVDSSVADHAVYSASLTSCHGARAGEQVALSDYDGRANGGSFQVLVISTYWTGCSPGRHDASEWGQIAETLRAEYPGQVAFLTSLKGSSSCTAWGEQYLGDTPDSVSLLSDTDQVLHVGLFDDNPQYVIIDTAMVVRERFGSTGLDVTSIRSSVATYLAEADPAVDCVGAWSTCPADCSNKVYTVETERSGSGNPCDAADGATLACAAGEGDCPPNVNCAGFWSRCTELCEIDSVRTWTETTAASGQGTACPAPSNCEPGEGDCSDCVVDVCGVCGGTGHDCPQLATTTVIQGAVSLSGFVYAMKTQEIPLGSVELRQRVSTEVSGLDGDPSTLSIHADCATCAIRRLQIRAAAADLASVPLASVDIVAVGRRRLENPTGHRHRRLQTTTVELEITCTDDVSRAAAFESAETFGAAFIQAMIDVTPGTITAATGASPQWTDQDIADAMITNEGLQSVVATSPEYETTIFCNVREDLHDRFRSPSFVADTLSVTGTIIDADSISRTLALCAPAVGHQRHAEIVASAAHGLRNPRDLQFNPAHPNMLWVANNDTDDLTIIDMDVGVSSAMTLRDRAPFHYMERISSLSFDSQGNFATCQESRNSYNDLMVPNDFMGPTLYDGSFSELVNSRAQPCDVDDDSSTCYFTHIDMLHETPICMGIAHDNEQVTPFGHVYWLFDGMNGTLNRVDFQEPHGPGSLDHSLASVRRFSDVELTAVPGVPGHIMMDPHARVLYIADTGAGRIVRVDPDSGQFLRNARREFSIYSSMEATFEYSIYGCTSQDVFATGIDQPSGLLVDGLYVYVGEHGTGQVLVFEKSTGRRVSQVQTGAEGLFGLEMDGNGQLWYVDGPGNQVGKVVVDVGCPAAEAGDVATSSSVSWPAFECTSEVVDDTDEDRERYHHEAFLNTHNVSGAMSLDYSTMDASECGSVNFDVLLMEGFICHVCLPNPCANGGRCVHYDGVYTFGGFSCDCDGTGYEGDICQDDMGECVAAVGEQHHVEIVASAAHGLRNPRDLQFNPAHPNMLWVANNDTDDLTIIDMDVGVSSAMTLRDRAPFHYMERISSLSFDSQGNFATCQESRNSYNDLMVPNDFMGPTLYDGSFSELVNSRAQPCDVDDDSSTCYFTHIDMLHETPICMGIAHDNEQVTPFGHVYWLFDGMNGTLNRVDFQEPHGPGSLDHSLASVRRFSDVELTAVPGVPGHIMMDPHARVLYIADTGAGRIVRVDPDSGQFLRNARREFSIYSSMEATFEYSIYGCTSQDVFATGIDQPSGLLVDGLYVYVGEHGTGQVLVFEKSTGRRVSQVQTGAEGLFGLEMDGNGQLWYVDGPGNQVGKVVVDVGCPAAEAGDVATSSSVSWPAFECTSEVVDDTDEDRERYHHEAFLNTHNVSGAMSLDYSTMDASECGSVNFDVLLMEGFICHVCLPNPCANGGRCVHYDGVYTFGGFSCDCDGTGYEGDICQDDMGECVAAVGEQHHVEIVASAAHGLRNPRDLQFNPAHPNMLWVANNDTDDLTIIDMDVGVSSAMTLRDRAPFHYMERISSLSFDSQGNFATCQESRNSYNDLMVPNDFMGPTLYDGSFSELVNSRAQPCDVDDDSSTCYFTHIDMLHETPICMGIAHDNEQVTPFGHVYWLFDGMNGTLNRVDFQEPHGPGSLDHSLASVRRFSDVELTAVPGVPGHIMMDPHARVLYIADTGAGRIVRVDPDSGQFLRNARREFSIYSSMEATFEYSIYGCTSQDVFATGIDQPSGLLVDGLYVYVGEHGTGQVLVFEKSTGRRVSQVQTGAEGLFGLEMDGNGQLWYVDGPGNQVGKVVVDVGCPAAEAGDVATSSSVSWPAFECTSEVVDDTDEDRERYHREAFLNTHNVSGAMSLDYSTMDASECGSVNFDVLLMEGFICHVCLPNPCANGGRCVHYDGVYTFGGFSCDCDGTGYEGDICQDDMGECVAAVGEQHHVEIVASAAHGLRNPRDLQFNPAHPNMLWVANNDTDDLTIIDMDVGVSSAMTLRDRAPFHYMERISSLSFDSQGNFATCQESRNSYNDLMVPNDFMGPTLYDGSFSELVNSRAQPCDVDDDSSTCYFTHIDMLHETPICMGIAHDNEQVTPFGHVYWLFDGMNGTLNRVDFQEPHGPGSLDHSLASVRRFSDVELTAVPGVPGHIMMDPHARVLYIADTGAGRIVRVDPDSGQFLRNARREFSIYSSMEATFEYSIYGCTSQDVFATGIDQPSGLLVDGLYVYVGEHGTGQVLVFEKSTGRRVSQVQTGAEGLFGLEMDGNGQLWYVDGPGNQVGKVVVDVGCPAAEAGDVATSSSVSWPAFECTSEVVDDTDEDRERYHHEAFLNTHNVSGAMSLDYSTMDASECGSVNFDVLLMEGFICHVCLPNPCANGGRCVHYDGVYTFGGFSCDCDGTGYEGDICDAMQAANFVAAQLHLDLSIEAVSGDHRDTFISNFRLDIAALAQVELSQVVIDDIRPGSVVVSFRIVSAAPGSPATSPSAGLEFLQQSLVRAARLDRIGVEVDSSVLVITAHVDEAGNPVSAETSFRDVGQSADQSSSQHTDESNRLLIALVAGTVLGSLVGLVCCSTLCKRRGDTDGINVEPKLSQLQFVRTTPPSTPADVELQAPQPGEKSNLIRGIVNARVTVNGRHEFKVRWADGRDSWVDKSAVSNDQVAKYEARKARHQHLQWQGP